MDGAIFGDGDDGRDGVTGAEDGGAEVGWDFDEVTVEGGVDQLVFLAGDLDLHLAEFLFAFLVFLFGLGDVALRFGDIGPRLTQGGLGVIDIDLGLLDLRFGFADFSFEFGLGGLDIGLAPFDLGPLFLRLAFDLLEFLQRDVPFLLQGPGAFPFGLELW